MGYFSTCDLLKSCRKPMEKMFFVVVAAAALILVGRVMAFDFAGCNHWKGV